MIDFVSINETTGQATSLFQLPIPSGYEAATLTYNPLDGQFYGILHDNANGTQLFATINPVSQSMTPLPFTGFPVGEIFEGLEYLQGVGLVVSHGTTNATTKLSEVGPTGNLIPPSMPMPTIVDQDRLAANACGGKLHAFDTNHPTAGFTVNEWTDPFGSPSLTGVYNGPVDTNNDYDAAIDPLTNTFYVTRYLSLWYYNLSPANTAVMVGNFNYPNGIAGIAAVNDCAAAIPTLTEWGMIIFALLLAGWMSFVVVKRWRRSHAMAA